MSVHFLRADLRWRSSPMEGGTSSRSLAETVSSCKESIPPIEKGNETSWLSSARSNGKVG